MDEHEKLWKSKEARVADYKALFTSPIGEKILADIMQKYGVTSAKFYEDPCMNAYANGRRSVVLEIISNLNFDVKKFREMAKRGELPYEY